MNQEIDRGEQAAKYFLGFCLHAILGSVGSLIFSMPINAAIMAVVKPDRIDSLSFVSLSISSVLIVFLLRFKNRDWVSHKWFSLTGPWVGVLGISALVIGLQELLGGWNPTLSHQTRLGYVLSQLFCVGPTGCSNTEGLDALFWGDPFVSWTSYSVASSVALWLGNRRRSAARATEIPAKSATVNE